MSSIEQNNSVAPYIERSGVNSDKYLDTLFAAPEVKLSDEEAVEIKEFSDALFMGKFENGLDSGTDTDLEEVYKMSPTKSEVTFYPEYFGTEHGAADLEKLSIGDVDQLKIRLNDYQAIMSETGLASLKEVAARSLDWYKEQLANALLEDPEKDQNFTDIESITVNFEPDKLLNMLEILQSYRSFYRRVRAGLKTESDGNLRTAKEAILNLHRAKINHLIAGYYASAINLDKQLAASHDEASKNKLKRLHEIMPVIGASFAQDRDDRITGIEDFAGELARRLDLLRNGAAWQEDQLSPISPELARLADSLNTDEDKITLATEMPQEVIEKLATTKWNATQLKELAEDVLAEWGFLSTVQSIWTETDSRQGFAEDGKWQVIISPQVQSMSVDGSKRIFTVPEKFNRSLTQETPAGALPGLGHELKHLLQNVYDYQLSEQVPLARMKGKRSLTMREVGAIDEEIKFQKKFGVNRGVQPHYYNAIKVKLSGGNKLQVARAFYDSLSKGNTLSPEKAKSNRATAADRALRFYRQGGHESQPLDYVEQGLIAKNLQNLPQDQKDVLLTAGVSFDLKDTAELHRLGVINLPETVSYTPTDTIWKIFSEKYLPTIVQAN